MKKGDLKRQEILKSAEVRFCREGYGKTSIQDILDDLQTSKGSFYHHFESKEALLEEICKNRAKSMSEKVFSSLTPGMNPEERLNTLISGMIPFSGEKLNFLLMLIPVFSGPEGNTIRNCYATELENIYLEKVAETLQMGTEEGLFACSDAEFSAGILMSLINRFWFELCERILENEKNEKKTDPGDLMSVVCNYRTTVERLLNAAFGSVQIVCLSDLIGLTDNIHIHWKE